MADVVWVEVKQQAQDGDPVNEWAIVVDNMVEHIEETEQDANRYAAGLRLEINTPAPRTYTVEKVDAAIKESYLAHGMKENLQFRGYVRARLEGKV